MKKTVWLGAAILVLVVGGLTVSGYNRLVKLDQDVQAQWGQVENTYQRRADLVPNLVETVKGAAKFEQDTLTAVTEARAKVGTMQLSPDILTNPEKMNEFESNQGALTSALSRLMVVVEKYPDLKATQNFANLQAQLEGTENRIAVARMDFINAVRVYNTELKTFPGVIWHAI